MPYSNPDNYVKYSGRLAEELAQGNPNGAIWANQFDNVANRRGHESTTGPEIYDQTRRQDRRFRLRGRHRRHAGAASALALKARNAAHQNRAGRSDGRGALFLLYIGELKSSGTSITEGIGQGRITANLVDAPIDIAYQITDEEALPILFDLAQHEGLLLGGSSAINIAGRDSAGAGSWAGQDHRHHPVRFRRALCVEAL